MGRRLLRALWDFSVAHGDVGDSDVFTVLGGGNSLDTGEDAAKVTEVWEAASGRDGGKFFFGVIAQELLGIVDFGIADKMVRRDLQGIHEISLEAASGNAAGGGKRFYAKYFGKVGPNVLDRLADGGVLDMKHVGGSAGDNSQRGEERIDGGERVARHDVVQQFRSFVAQAAIIACDAAERRGSEFAEEAVIVHADHADIEGHAQPDQLARFGDEPGTLIIHGKNANRVWKPSQPRGERVDFINPRPGGAEGIGGEKYVRGGVFSLQGVAVTLEPVFGISDVREAIVAEMFEAAGKKVFGGELTDRVVVGVDSGDAGRAENPSECDKRKSKFAGEGGIFGIVKNRDRPIPSPPEKIANRKVERLRAGGEHPLGVLIDVIGDAFDHDGHVAEPNRKSERHAARLTSMSEHLSILRR